MNRLVMDLNKLICKAETHIGTAREVERTIVRELATSEGVRHFSYTPEEATEVVKTALRKAKTALEEALKEEQKAT